MSWRTWQRAQDRNDPFLNAEMIRTEALRATPETGRAGTLPAEDEIVTTGPERSAAYEATRRDDVNGYYVTDMTLREE